jgi:hypothetical protein
MVGFGCFARRGVHYAPADIIPYRRHFGVTPQFEAEQCSLVIPANLLDRPVRGAARELRRILVKSVAEYWGVRKPSIYDRVIRVLRARVVFGGASLEDVADELGIHSRTLNRRLESEGTSFRRLLRRSSRVACWDQNASH